MWLEAVSKPEDVQAKCPTCGGGVRRRQYIEVYAGSFISDGKRVAISRSPPADFADPIVLDPLTQYFNGGLYRIWPSEKYYSPGGKRLPRDVWVASFGPVPVGCHIHHKDGDTSNDRLGNLECMPGREHAAQTRPHRAGDISPDARAKAAEWHRSEAGRLWHSRHAKRAKWKRVPKPCQWCGIEIMALVRKSGHAQKFCSEVCKAAAYRGRQKP